MVGGGGVGLVLFSYLKGFRYDISCTIILIIAVMVILVDLLTSYFASKAGERVNEQEKKSKSAVHMQITVSVSF